MLKRLLVIEKKRFNFDAALQACVNYSGGRELDRLQIRQPAEQSNGANR